VIGIFLLDLLTRKGGEAGFERMMSRKRFDYCKNKMNERAAYTYDGGPPCSAAVSVPQCKQQSVLLTG
jgi:hypothetical protein